MDVFETIFDDGPLNVKNGSHTINIAILVGIINNQKIILDKDHSDYDFVDINGNRCNRYIKRVIEQIK